MSDPSFLARAGFDVGRLRFGITTAFASVLALIVATVLGLDHPQWAGMTVWAASQPYRAQLLEKSFFRAAGSLSGSIAGVLLLVLAGDRPILLVVGLAIWIGACAGIGNIQRGFVSYGTMLAGYSAAMVSLLEVGEPTHVVALGLDRMATVLTGVGVALVVGLATARDGGEEEIRHRVHRLTARLLRDVGRRIDRPLQRMEAEQGRILAEMAAIEAAMDPHAAGSLRSRRTVRSLRSLLIAEVAVLLWLRSPRRRPLPRDLGASLEAAAAVLEGERGAATIAAAMDAAVARASADRVLADALAGVAGGLVADLSGDAAGKSQGEQPAPVRRSLPLVLHHDWIGARQATIRATATMLTVGCLWLVTGWSGGPFLLLGTAIMTSLFSTFDDPARFMGNVLGGQVLGAAAALVCHWLVWPAGAGPAVLIACMVPFMLLGAPVFAHRRTAPYAFDYNMVFLLLLQPTHPGTGDLRSSLMVAAAVVGAPILAWISYRALYPVDTRRRLAVVIAMMVHDLGDMARSSAAPVARQVWRVRLYHRLLRLVRLAGETGEDRIALVEGALAVLEVGSMVATLRRLADDGTHAPSVRRRIEAVLRRVEDIARRPDLVRRALETSAPALQRAGLPEAERLLTAARSIELNASFFELGLKAPATP